MASLKYPRDYAGMKAAPICEFFESYMRLVGDGDDDRNDLNKRVCDHIMSTLRARNVFDLGGLMHLHHHQIKTILEEVEHEESLDYFITSFEDLLEFKFRIEEKVHNVLEPPSSHKLVVHTQERKSEFVEEGAKKLGAEMTANGTINDFRLSRDMFPEVKTANVLLSELTEPEVKYVVDQLWLYTVSKTGALNVDKIWREHLGCQARAIFPNLPDKGKKGSPRYIAGKDRKFTDMLYHRFTNPRKAASKTIGYKATMQVDRKHVCDATLALIERVGDRFPVQVVDGVLEPKFNIPNDSKPAAGAPLPSLAEQAALTWSSTRREASGQLPGPTVSGAPPMTLGGAAALLLQQTAAQQDGRQATQPDPDHQPPVDEAEEAAGEQQEDASGDENRAPNEKGGKGKGKRKTQQDGQPKPKKAKKAKKPAEPTPVFQCSLSEPVELFKKSDGLDDFVAIEFSQDRFTTGQLIAHRCDIKGSETGEFFSGAISLVCKKWIWIKYHADDCEVKYMRTDLYTTYYKEWCFLDERVF